MEYWQVAAGQGARDYSDIFLRFGVMLVGDGTPGSFSENKGQYRRQGRHAHIVRFAEQVSEDDDIVILKRPHHRQWEIQAVGRVAGDYEYLAQFDDVEGWDIRHCRRVEWVRPSSSVITNGLSIGAFKRVSNRSIRDQAIRVLDEGDKVEPVDIPGPARDISDEDLIETLIGSGLRPGDAETVIQTIWRGRRLATWYSRFGRDLGEHEIRTFSDSAYPIGDRVVRTEDQDRVEEDRSRFVSGCLPTWSRA